jgi:hypothetical protein
MGSNRPKCNTIERHLANLRRAMSRHGKNGRRGSALVSSYKLLNTNDF